MPVLDAIALEHPGILVPRSFIAWDKAGRLILRTSSRDAIFRDRTGRYFRDNTSGSIYRIINKSKTERIPAEAIKWISGVVIAP